MPLWSNTKCAAWRDSVQQYDALLAAHNINELVNIDAWYRGELPGILTARDPAYVTKDEFLEILRWKMKRGDWREHNRIRIVGIDARVIKKTAQDAFAA